MMIFFGIRFPLALATAALVALTGTLAGTPTQAATAKPETPAGPDVELVHDPGSVVRAATVPVLDQSTARSTARAATVGPRLNTSKFKMLAVTWRGSVEPRLSVRTRDRADGGWTRWTSMETLHDGPNGKTPRGTDLIWVGPSDGVQVRSTGATANGLELVLINPGRKPGDAHVKPNRQALASSHARTAAASAAPEPPLLGRGKWGADNSWRNGTVRYNKQVKQVHVHHTASGNNYSRADVPGILRGIYRYHTKSLGWFDIGYNFIVDKYGRTWVGRSGGPRRPVRGAHTLGFNQNTVGIAVLGNLDSVKVNKRTARGIIQLSAWKLDKYGKKANGTVVMRSQGSDRFRNGKYVRLPVIDGHRDTNQTACPGAKLYAQLPTIRRVTQARVAKFN